MKTIMKKMLGVLLVACVLAVALGCVSNSEMDARQQLIKKCQERNIAINQSSIVFLNAPTPTPFIHSPLDQSMSSSGTGTTFLYIFNTTDGKPHSADVLFGPLGTQSNPMSPAITITIDGVPQ